MFTLRLASRCWAPHWFLIASLAFATWLSIFAADDARPSSPQERADLLAAENYRSLELSAPMPPSPPHWAQRYTGFAEEAGRRYVVARESAALWMAAWGGSAKLAGVVAFGLAGFVLAWAVLGIDSTRSPLPRLLLAASAMIGVAHGRDWQTHDPLPFLILAGAALCLGAWVRLRDQKRSAWLATFTGLGFALLLLSAPALALVMAIALGVDAIFQRRSREQRRFPAFETKAWLTFALFPLLAFLFMGVRNQAIHGSPWKSPAYVYASTHITAPSWFWERVRTPPDHMDEVLERFDETVALPESRWSAPVYRRWLEGAGRGLALGGGWALGAAAVLSLCIAPDPRIRALALTFVGMFGLVLVRFRVPDEWWPFAAPAMVLITAWSLTKISWRTPSVVFCVAVWLVALLHAPKSQLTAAEYTYSAQIKEVVGKLAETPGQHLVFVRMDDSSSARLEPADLPRAWETKDILYARDLSPQQNAFLAAALPDRVTWRIIVFNNRIGLQRLPPSDNRSPTSS